MSDLASSLSGVTVPLVTPFDDRGAIDWAAYDRLLSHVVDAGVEAVFPCGTTGEFASLSSGERRQLVAHTTDVAPADVTVLAGATGTSVPGTIEWVEEAGDCGVDAVVATAPYFHTSNGAAGLRRFFERVADRSPVPVVLYNIPACVGEPLPVETVATLADHDRVAGLKDSSGDLAYGLRVEGRVPDEFLVLQGYDPLVRPSLLSGFEGGVNALANAIPGAYVELVSDPTSKRARTLHQKAVEPLFALCREEGFAPATKAVLAERGVLPSSDVRPPLVPLEGDRVRTAVSRVESILD